MALSRMRPYVTKTKKKKKITIHRGELLEIQETQSKEAGGRPD